MAELNFGGVVETVVTSKEFSVEKAREVLKDEVIAVIGYGIQGPGQACNLRDNGCLGRRFSALRRLPSVARSSACSSAMPDRFRYGPASRST